MMKTFDFEKVAELASKEKDQQEILKAEKLAEMFLKWKPLEDDPEEEADAMTRLKGMLTTC
jgi:hypothetical protein